MTKEEERDAWSSDAYQKAAAFVPKLATKVVQWLDAQPDDNILDIGCGDGVLTLQIAQSLTTGHITGLDSSKSMIDSATAALHQQHQQHQQQTLDPSPSHPHCTFHVLDARDLAAKHQALHLPPLDAVFSNAALHWILHDAGRRTAVFQGVHAALKPGGRFVFEMGGEGNVAEMRGAIRAAVARRAGAAAARAADPWFFPDEAWMRRVLAAQGFVVERMEMEARPTGVEAGEGGGVEGWVRLMGSRFFDVLGEEGEEAREQCVREVVARLEEECRRPDGRHVIEYVRLRALARKVG